MVPFCPLNWALKSKKWLSWISELLCLPYFADLLDTRVKLIQGVRCDIKTQEHAFKAVSVAYSMLLCWAALSREETDSLGAENHSEESLMMWFTVSEICQDLCKNPAKCPGAVCSSLPGQSREKCVWVGCISQPPVSHTHSQTGWMILWRWHRNISHILLWNRHKSKRVKRAHKTGHLYIKTHSLSLLGAYYKHAFILWHLLNVDSCWAGRRHNVLLQNNTASCDLIRINLEIQ